MNKKYKNPLILLLVLICAAATALYAVLFVLRDDVTAMVPRDCDIDLEGDQEKFGNMIRMIVAIHVLERIKREFLRRDRND